MGYVLSLLVLLASTLTPKYDYSEEPVEQNWGAEIYPGRTNWDGHGDFIMASLALSFGVGNFTIFPFQCVRYGNVLYMVPYLVCVVFIALPMMMVEMSLGQYTSHGLLTCWKMAPIFKGIGIGMLIVAFPVVVYYNMMLGWCILYLYQAIINIAGTPPWESCSNSFNTPYCQYNLHEVNATSCSQLRFTVGDNGVCFQNTTIPYGIWNFTLAAQNNIYPNRSTAEYMIHVVLGVTRENTFTDLGLFRWESLAALAASWVLIYIGMFFGVKTAGKIAYFVVTVPLLFFFGLLCYLVTFDGAGDGLKYFVTEVDWSILYSAEAWENAANIAIFSGGAVGGGQMVLCSYNSFHNNLLRDAIILNVCEVLYSVVTTLLVYSAAGMMALNDGTSIAYQLNDEQVAFQTFPHALSKTSQPGILLVLYFLSLLTLGYSQFFYIEACSTSIFDVFPKLHRPKYRRLILAVLCLAFVAAGVPMCYQGGIYVYIFLSIYTSGGNLQILGVLQSLGISWIYGVRNFQQDVGLMLGNQKTLGMTWKRYSKFFMGTWAVVAPTLALVAAVVTYSGIASLEYDDYEYPSWTYALGFVFAVANIGGLLIYCVYALYKTKGSFKERIIKNFTPTEEWGPALIQHRVKVGHLKNYSLDPHWLGSDRVDYSYSYKPYFMARRRRESYA